MRIGDVIECRYVPHHLVEEYRAAGWTIEALYAAGTPPGEGARHTMALSAALVSSGPQHGLDAVGNGVIARAREGVGDEACSLLDVQ